MAEDAHDSPMMLSMQDPACRADCPYIAGLNQSQRQQSIGLMVSEVAHDLNNLFSIMLGHTELALEEQEDGKSALSHLRDMREAVVYASALCRGILSYAGRAEPVRTQINLSDLVVHLRQLLRVIVPQQSRLECHIEPRLPCVTGDPSHLRQILMNLILNAVEALGGRPGVVRLQIDRMPANAVNGVGAGAVRIRVSDTGCGMDSHVLKNLFAPFFSTKASGRGVGLTAVRSLIEGMEGTIQVGSVPGQGSTFTLVFPVQDTTSACCDGDAPEDEIEELNWSGGGTVLLVDDEPELRTMGSAMLDRAGLQVLTATDGLEAVECYRNNADKIDLVFMDAMMPRMDGCEALEHIRRMDPSARVVMISGHTELDLARRWSTFKPDDILLKPVSAEQFRRTAIRHLALRSVAASAPTS